MPIYEFICKEHGNFEKIFSKPVEVAKCPDCGRPGIITWSVGAKRNPDHGIQR